MRAERWGYILEGIWLRFLFHREMIIYEDEWYWGGKVVTQTEFNTLLEKTAGKNLVTMKDSDWYDNTAANRKDLANLIKQ